MAGSTLGVGALVVTAVLAVGVGAVGSAAIRSAQVSTSADAAALAAADTASGFATGAPCERARELVERAGFALSGCRLDGLVATVEVSATAGVLPVVARARAGPPPGPPGA